MPVYVAKAVLDIPDIIKALNFQTIMQRHFTILATFAVLLILIVGGSVYWLSKATIEQSKQQAMQATAAGVAANLSAQTDLLQQLVNTLAQSPSVVSALSSGDPAKLKETAEQLQRYIPGALKVRLFLPESPDKIPQTPPDIGFADLEMARQSFINQPLPAILELGNNQHLAISAKTVKDNLAIGVLLASLEVQPINQGLQVANVSDGYLSLKQGELTILERGNTNLNISTQAINVEHTPWRIQYSHALAIDTRLQILLLGIITAAGILAALIFWKGYRNFETLFIGDRSMILTAMKDLVNRRMHDIYPMSFKEMEFVVESLYALNQTFKRQPQSVENSEPYLFTEESEDFFQTPAEKNISPPEVADPSNRPDVDFSPISLVASLHQTALDSIFSPGVIRGIVDKTLNKEVLYDLGRAFGSELQTQAIHKITLAYDGRKSSIPFAEAFAQGMITTGVDILEIGLAPIPLLYFTAQLNLGRTGAMITGGHSPSHINGVKFLVQGEFAYDKLLQAIKNRMATKDFIETTVPGNIEKTMRYNDEYLNKIVQDILLLKPLKVVTDCGNGVAGNLAPKLFKALGCEVFELFSEVDGTFPNHLPDPSKSENMNDLMTAVVHYHADLGIAFDGDGDRLGVVDSGGRIVSPEQLMQLCAKQILQTHCGVGIVYDEKCSKQMATFISQQGGKPIPCKTGHALSQLRAKAPNAVFAGELSGRMIFNDRWIGLDDALYAAARLLEILSTENGDSKAVFNALILKASEPQ